MKRRTFAIAIAIAVAVGAVGVAAPAADAQAVGKRCRPVKAGAYRATHVFADYMSCRSARTKLRRWLRRGQLPKKFNGWYCYRLGGIVRACTYPGRSGADKGFTFWLRRASHARAAAPIKECGDYPGGVGAGVYNITTRVTRCRVARRMARRFWHGHWKNVPRTDRPRSGRRFRRGSYTCRNRHIGTELNDMRCTASRGRVVRWQWGS
jgi:hypothetical protein